MAKVLLVAEFGTFGGVRTHFERLVEFYVSRGDELVVAVTRQQVDDRFIREAERFGFRYTLRPERRAGPWRIVYRMPVLALADILGIMSPVLRERPDLVVASVALPGSLLALAVLPVRFLYILHTLPTGASTLRFEKRVLARFFGAGKRLVTVSDHSKREIARYWMGPERSHLVSVIPNGSPDPLAGSLARKTDEAGPMRVLTVGHLEWYKNPLVWLDVAQRVVDEMGPDSVEFVWVGDGPLREQCEDRLRTMGLCSVRFVGFQQDPAAFHARSTLYFQPSLLESHGMAVVDAMAWERPCVVSDRGGLPESVIDGETGFVVSTDAAAMAARIVTLLRDPELRRRMGQAGRMRWRERFTPERWTREMERLHVEVLAGRVAG